MKTRNNCSVLVVEDETIVAFDIRKSVERLGYHVTGTAATGEKAVELASRFRPDLVLMDISLAGEMNGIEAALKIRTEYGAKIVFLSAFDDDKTVDRMKDIGMAGFITKPFHETELKLTLGELLGPAG